MKKFKYFYLSDPNKEVVGNVISNDEEGAYEMASLIKKLPLKEFKKIFGVIEV